MHSALLFIAMPDTATPDGKQRWLVAGRSIEDATAKHSGIETLGENCWLIPLGSGASALAEFVRAADSHKLQHRVLFFEKAPDWVRSKADGP